MRLVYVDEDEEQLGKVSHSSFHKVLIPFFEENGPSSFIYRHFSGNATTTWAVKDVSVEGSDVTIKLSDAGSSTSIGRMAEGNNKGNANRLITKYGVVEVDFGHKASVLSIGDQVPVNNTHCAGSHLPGELYKRRPCIVLSVSADRVQVMPLTTKDNAPDPASIELSERSFSRLNGKYTSASCHTLPRMIQTVSSHRVYPPMLQNGTFPTKCSQYTLCSADKEALKASLASIYSSELEHSHEVLKIQLEQLRKEKASIFNALQSAKQKIAEYTAIDVLIAQMGEEYGAEGTSTDILQQFLSEESS